LLYLGCAMEKTARWKFLKLWQIMYLDITIPWCNLKKIDWWENFRVTQVYTLKYGFLSLVASFFQTCSKFVERNCYWRIHLCSCLFAISLQKKYMELWNSILFVERLQTTLNVDLARTLQKAIAISGHTSLATLCQSKYEICGPWSCCVMKCKIKKKI